MLCAVEFEDRVVILHAATIDPCPWPRTIACVKRYCERTPVAAHPRQIRPGAPLSAALARRDHSPPEVDARRAEAECSGNGPGRPFSSRPPATALAVEDGGPRAVHT
jgi:hypothetical protein